MPKLKLPQGWKTTDLFHGPTYENGGEIQYYFCNSCTKRTDCADRKELAMAMGEDYPFWSNDFIAVRVPMREDFPETEIHVLCRNYDSKLKTIQDNPEFIHGVSRLLQVTSKNKNKKNNNKEYKTHEGEKWFEEERAKGDFCEEDMFRS